MSAVGSPSEATTTNNLPRAPTGHGDQELSESQRVDKVQYPKEDEPRLQPEGQNAFNSERPLNVQPTQAGRLLPRSHSRKCVNFCITLGGVARGGRDDVPLEKAGLVDKVVGKTEKVVYLFVSPFSSSDIVTLTGDRQSYQQS